LPPSLILDVLQLQHHLQRHGHWHCVAARRGFLQLGLDVLPCVPSARLFRQMPEERPHVGEAGIKSATSDHPRISGQAQLVGIQKTIGTAL
jgi:hypothetical protein